MLLWNVDYWVLLYGTLITYRAHVKQDFSVALKEYWLPGAPIEYWLSGAPVEYWLPVDFIEHWLPVDFIEH